MRADVKALQTQMSIQKEEKRAAELEGDMIKKNANNIPANPAAITKITQLLEVVQNRCDTATTAQEDAHKTLQAKYDNLV